MAWPKEEAREYLRDCITRLPVSWWRLYRGAAIREVLQFLAETSYPHPQPTQGRLYNRTIRPFEMPDPCRFMAYCLHTRSKRRKLGGPYLERIRINGWAFDLFKTWDSDFDGSEIPRGKRQFYTWATERIHQNLVPGGMVGLSEAHVAFRNYVVDTIQVLRATDQGLTWEVGVDMDMDPEALRLQFEGGQENQNAVVHAPLVSETGAQARPTRRRL